MTAKAPTRPDRPFRFTREQYYEMGKRGYFDGKRVELLYGEIVEMSPVNWPHRSASGWFPRPWRGSSPLVFRIRSNHSQSPELRPFRTRTGCCDSGKLTLHRSPPVALLVEVSDATLLRPTTKAEMYATAGVAKYWVLMLMAAASRFRDPTARVADGTHTTAYQRTSRFRRRIPCRRLPRERVDSRERSVAVTCSPKRTPHCRGFCFFALSLTYFSP